MRIREVCQAISELVIPGLNLKDINAIPAEVGLRSPSVLLPLPNIVTDFSLVRDSYGGGSTAKMTSTYTLNYRLLYQAVGTSTGLTLTAFLGMTEMIVKILDKVIALDVLDADHDEVVDIVPVSVLNMGIVNDPSDRAFFGCDFAFMVTEFIN